MAYGKQLPLRASLSANLYDLLIEGLKSNENIFAGKVADDATALREKIEKYGRRVTDENGDEVVHLGFYEKEGVKFIWQFLAAARMAKDCRELLACSDKVCSESDPGSPINLDETEV